MTYVTDGHAGYSRQWRGAGSGPLSRHAAHYRLLCAAGPRYKYSAWAIVAEVSGFSPVGPQIRWIRSTSIEDIQSSMNSIVLYTLLTEC